MISVIEEAGAVVVAESVCFGIRGVADNVSSEGDPVGALVIRYMEESICPRFIMSFDKRLDYIKKKATQAKVQGAIFQNIRFCEFHGSENSVIESAFEELDIPSVCLEREHGPLNEKGRMRLRIDALLNRI
jgi:benzoyl-CoA reductase subunit C